MSTILSSCTSWYNPFACNGRQVNAIYILKDGEIFRSTKWFDYSNQEFRTVEFPWDAKVKRTIDLNSKVAFLISTKNCLNDKAWDLYIPIELLDDVVIEEEKSAPFGDDQIHYTTAMRFTLPKFKLKHPDAPNAKAITGRVSITKHRFEDNDFGKRLKKLSAVAKEQGVDIPYYQFKYLLKVFNISVKRKAE